MLNKLADPTVIPGAVKSQISLRIVPDQDLETISKSLTDFLEDGFQKFQSPNQLKVTSSDWWSECCLTIISQVKIERTADWWLGSLDDPWFKALENAVSEEWGVSPLRIREGGVC